MRESEFRNALIESLVWHKFEIIRVHPGKRQLINGGWIQGPDIGTFDYVVGYPKDGVYLLAYFEAKQGRDRLNADQIRFARKVGSMGVPWLVATCYQDVEKWQKDITYHGTTEAIATVFSDEVFVPSEIRSKKQKLTMKAFMEFNRWEDKKKMV